MATNTMNKRSMNKNDFAAVSKRSLVVPTVPASKQIKESDVLRWSQNAKKLHRSGKLSKLA